MIGSEGRASPIPRGFPARLPKRFALHAAIQVALLLAYFLPGGFFWNRVEPRIFGVPFGAFMVAGVLPILIAANMAAYVLAFWKRDAALTRRLQTGEPYLGPETAEWS